MSPSDPRVALFLRWSARLASLLSIGVLLLFLTGDDGLIGGNGWARSARTSGSGSFSSPSGSSWGWRWPGGARRPARRWLERA
jgi:hypothetical protein